jgi:kinesin family protein 1
VAVKVLDKRHNAIYTWSLDRMQQQLGHMRNLTTYIDRPSYTQHFSSDEPFYDTTPSEYSFIGNALISLAPLSRRLSSTSTVPIFCRYTAEAIGSCRVDIKIVNVQLSPKHANGSSASTRASSPSPGTVPPGSKIGFYLTVDSVKGLSSHDFSAVHLQVRLSSFVGPLGSEEVFSSPALDIDASTLSELRFRRIFSIVASTKVLAHMREGYAPIEFFATIRPTYLERLERWDEMREQKLRPPPSRSSPVSENAPAALPPMRRSETDFVVTQTHDVVAWLQMCELAPDGEYAPVPVLSQGNLDPGCFSLHQGLQRRINLMLSSNSGYQLPWMEFTKIRIGNVRLLDNNGRVHDSTSKAMVTLPLMKDQVLEFKPDGTGHLAAEALWDTSIHDSLLLNRVTATNQRVILQLNWAVAVDTCSDPVQFNMDVGIMIQTRDARPPSKLMAFLGSTKILTKSSSLFSVRLSPPLTRSPRDLWRLDTSEKYVRGEEALGTWKPRGLSVVQDYERLVSTERRAADVQAIRVVLTTTPPRPVNTETLAWKSDELLKRSVELWQKQFGHRGEVSPVYSDFPPTQLSRNHVRR